MPVTRTPVASSALTSSALTSGAVASNTVVSTQSIATQVASTTTTTTAQLGSKRERVGHLPARPPAEGGGSRPRVKIDLDFKNPITVVDEDNKIDDNSLEREDVEDIEIMDQLKLIVAKPSFSNEIIDFFSKKNHIDPELVSIDKFNGLGINAFGHSILTYNEIKWHAKPAIHAPRTSLGSKYNELAFYKINELLKIGPECDGFVSKDGVLMILTKDLNYRSLGEAMGEEVNRKKITFKDNLGLKEKCDDVPERHRENVHRCVTEICITLLSLSDVQRNLGNTGFKKTNRVLEDSTEVEKFKPFIVDFRLLNTEDATTEKGPFSSLPEVGTFCLSKHKIKKINEYALELQKILLDEKTSDQEFPKNIFAFKKNPSVVKDALTKLFLDENGDINKLNKAIEDGFAFAMKKLTESCDRSSINFSKHSGVLNALKTEKLEMLNIFLENPTIKTFLEEEGKKIKTKISTEETKSSPRTDVSPTNSTGQSIGSASTDSPLPLYLFLAMIF